MTNSFDPGYFVSRLLPEQGRRKGKKDKDNSDGGGRQGKKTKDKPDFAKRKSRKKKNIKTRQKAGKTGRTQRRRFMSYGALYIDRPAVASHASMCDLLI